MQTFLPYPDFAASAKVLDRQRLGKQRVEGYQILKTLTGRSSGWSSHPAVKMWEGHPFALAMYTLSVCSEWTSRGYKDTVAAKVIEIIAWHSLDSFTDNPPWMNDGRLTFVCASHRSNLLRKNPEHYRQLGWTEATNLEYYWPSSPSITRTRNTMSDNENVAVAAPDTPVAGLEDIALLIDSQRANITDAIGEKAVARANKRLDVARKILEGNAKTVHRQTAYANRPKREKTMRLVKDIQAEAAEAAAAVG